MQLYKDAMAIGKRTRNTRSMKVSIDELPVRPIPKYSTPRDREKYIKTCEAVVRKSLEYKEYIKFLKDHMDMNQCAVLQNVISKNGKHYRIEVHHEPFTLFDIVETVINRRLQHNQPITELQVADEVTGLHYDGKIGLIPLTVTMHELVHNGRIFIPLQLIYHDYAAFYQEYQPYMNSVLLDKIEAKVNLSLHTQNIVSDSLDVEFVTLEVDGYQFPQIPDEWKNAISGEAVELLEADSE